MWTPDYLMRTAGLQSVYPALNNSREVPGPVQAVVRWQHHADGQPLAIGKPREGLKTSWFSEWDKFNQVQVQNAILGKISPTEAVTTSANKARELKKAV